jgi:hypothetical protein
MEHRWVLIMSYNACGFSSSGCAAHRDTFAKAGTAHSIFDSFTSFTGCSYVVYRSFIGASGIQLLRWKHKIWKVLNSYERHHDFITTSATSCLKGDQILVNEDIYGGMHRLLTQERNTAKFILPKHSYLCHAWSMYADLYHLVFFDVLYFQNIFSYLCSLFSFVVATIVGACWRRWSLQSPAAGLPAQWCSGGSDVLYRTSSRKQFNSL